MRTSLVESFYGREYLAMVERCNGADAAEGSRQACFAEVDMRNPRKRRVTTRDVALLYGHRPRGKANELWYMSPYDFTAAWEPKLLSYPLSAKDVANPKHHVRVTQSGLAKLRRAAQDPLDLVPGIDYEVGAGGHDWHAFPDSPSTLAFRHTWILLRRRRPVVPSFAGCPSPRHANASEGQTCRNACLVMAYFHPWTLSTMSEDKNDEHVPHVSRLRPAGTSWEEAMQVWFQGRVSCPQVQRIVGNFLAVHRMRPADDESDAGNSEDMLDDADVDVDHANLAQALTSRVAREAEATACPQSGEVHDSEGGERARAIRALEWSTVRQSGAESRAPRQISQTSLSQPISTRLCLAPRPRRGRNGLCRGSSMHRSETQGSAH